MPYKVPIEEAEENFPEYDFISQLTPSEQKCAFHVREKETGRDLCLKLVAPNYNLDRLHREIQALQEIDHPNVVRYIEYTYSSKQAAVRHYIVEEFIEGNDLADLLGSPWEHNRVVVFFKAVAAGLEALRSAQVVHRDLKPQNIRVRPDGTPAIIDFGLARHLSKPSLTETGAGAQIGTPLYFAPEQFRGTKRDIDHRTDLFALGVILHEALTGFHPYASAQITRPELEQSVCSGFVGSPEFEALPPLLKLVVKKLLAVERSNRIASAALLRVFLGKVGA